MTFTSALRTYIGSNEGTEKQKWVRKGKFILYKTVFKLKTVTRGK